MSICSCLPSSGVFTAKKSQFFSVSLAFLTSQKKLNAQLWLPSFKIRNRHWHIAQVFILKATISFKCSFHFCRRCAFASQLKKKSKKKNSPAFLRERKNNFYFVYKRISFFFVVFLFCFYNSVPNFLSAFYSNFNLKFLYSLKVCIYIQIHGFRDLNLMHCNFHNWYFSAFPFWI